MSGPGLEHFHEGDFTLMNALNTEWHYPGCDRVETAEEPLRV